MRWKASVAAGCRQARTGCIPGRRPPTLPLSARNTCGCQRRSALRSAAAIAGIGNRIMQRGRAGPMKEIAEFGRPASAVPGRAMPFPSPGATSTVATELRSATSIPRRRVPKPTDRWMPFMRTMCWNGSSTKLNREGAEVNNDEKEKLEQALFEAVDDVVRVYTGPRISGYDQQERRANIIGVKIIADGIIIAAQENFEQKRGVRVEVLVQFGLLTALSDLLVKLRRDQVGIPIEGL